MNEQQSDLLPLRKVQKLHSSPIEVGAQDSQSENFRMAKEISNRIKQQTQNDIREKILSVQKQVMDQNRKNVGTTRDIVKHQDKQINSPKIIYKLERLTNESIKSKQNSQQRNGIGVQQVPVTDEIEPGHVPMDQIKNVEMQSGYQRPPSKNFSQNELKRVQQNKIMLETLNNSTDDQEIKKRLDEDGPKLGRGMGFPNMKYLDPDAHGMPILEKTLYKEYQQNKDNDIKLQREGFINARKDIANSTFIKLFQAQTDPQIREEIQSVQYIEESASANEDTKIIIQKSSKYLKRSNSKAMNIQNDYFPPLNKREYNNNSQPKINQQLPGIQAPQGLTQVPVYSGSIPSLQQESTKGLNYSNSHLSPAQQFLNYQIKSSTILPPISQRINNDANHRFNMISYDPPLQQRSPLSYQMTESNDPSPLKQRNQDLYDYAPHDSREDKLMRDILDGYSNIMNSNQSSKENIYLKKIRFHHPIFKDLNFNAFKMIFDLCEVVQIKKGQILYKKDQHINDIYFVMHGVISLRQFNYENEQILGQSLGEEILFFADKKYRETAICKSSRCCILQIRAEYLFELWDESFNNRGLNSEAMKADMEVLFQRIRQINEAKEIWRKTIQKNANQYRYNKSQ